MRILSSRYFILLLLIATNINLRAQDKPVGAPNVILFLIDDMGLMDSSLPFLTDGEGQARGYALNTFYRTPHMERLARQGVRFSNFYAHSVCSPSRTSIMTGQNAARHGVTNWIHPESNNRTEFGPSHWNWSGLDKNAVTLPKLFQQKGYKTIHVGKAHFGPMGSEGEDPTNIGFDINIGGSSIGQPGSYQGTEGYGYTGGDRPRAVPGLEKYHGTDTFLTEALTLEAKDAISQAQKEGKPFFLNLSHYAVHQPFYSDPRFAAHYENSGQSKLAQAYATLIEGMDKSLGDIMTYVQEIGLGENTLIIFLGDNGSDAPLDFINNYGSSAPLKGKKGNHWEGGMRVPFIAGWISPNKNNIYQKRLPIAPNSIQQQLGSILDLFPTIAHLTDLKVPKNHMVDGFDLKDQFAGRNHKKRTERFLNSFPHAHNSSYFVSLVDQDWKVVYFYEPKSLPRYELFHLKNDPFETNNVAIQEPAQLKRMMQLLTQEMEAKHGLYPEKEQQPMSIAVPQ